MAIVTTVVGSYPVKALKPEEAIQRAVTDQIEAGIDIISDGQVRADMIGIFAQKIPGYDCSGKGYKVKSKIDIPPEPITIADYYYAKSLAGDTKVKGILTGPTTMAMASSLAEGAPYQSITDPAFIMDLAEVLAYEARALRGAGAQIIQIDEPFFSIGADLEAGFKALERVTGEAELAILHVCGDVRPIFQKLLDAPVAILDIEGANLADLPWVNRELLQDKGKKISYGCISSNTDEVESLELVIDRIKYAIEKIGKENLWLSPDCGLRLRTREAALEKLKRMVKAASLFEA